MAQCHLLKPYRALVAQVIEHGRLRHGLHLPVQPGQQTGPLQFLGLDAVLRVADHALDHVGIRPIRHLGVQRRCQFGVEPLLHTAIRRKQSPLLQALGLLPGLQRARGKPVGDVEEELLPQGALGILQGHGLRRLQAVPRLHALGQIAVSL